MLVVCQWAVPDFRIFLSNVVKKVYYLETKQKFGFLTVLLLCFVE